MVCGDLIEKNFATIGQYYAILIGMCPQQGPQTAPLVIIYICTKSKGW